MKIKLRVKAILIVLALFIAFLPGKALAAEAEDKVITLASPSFDAMQGYNEYQEMYQYTYEYLDMIANYANWDIELVYAESGDLNEALMECLEMVMDGRADLSGGILKNEAMEQLFAYPRNSYGTAHTVLLTKQNEPYLYESNLGAQTQLRVAVLESAAQRNRETTEYLDSRGAGYTLISCETYEEQLSLLADGGADAMVGVDVAPVEGMKQLAAYAEREIYLVSAKGNEFLIAELDSAIDTVNQVLPGFQPDLFEKTFTIPQESFSLTDAQAEYVQNREPVQVLFNGEAPPFQYKDKNGEIQGVFVEVLDRISALTGLKFVYLEPEDGQSAKELLETGACDMTLSMPAGNDWAVYYDVLQSVAVVDSGYIRVFNKNTYDPEREDMVLALPRGTLVTPDFTPKETLYYADAKACMDAVNNGEADCTIINDHSYSYYHAQHPYSKLDTEMYGEYNISYGFAFAKPLDVELATIVNTAIQSIPQETIYTNMSEIMSAGAQSTVWGMYMWDPVRISIIAVGLLFLLFITLFFVTSYHLLRKKNRQLVKASAAKSDFLSHVSHEIRTPLNTILGFSDLAIKEHDDSAKAEYLKNIQSSGQYLLGIINDILDMSNAANDHITLIRRQVAMCEVVGHVQVMLRKAAQDRNIQIRYVRDYPEELQVLTDEQRLQQIYINLLSNAVKYSHPGGTVDCITRIRTGADEKAVCEIEVSDHGVGISSEFLDEIFKPFTQEKNQYTTALNSCGLGLSIVQQIAASLNGTVQVESHLGEGSRFTVVLPVETVVTDNTAQPIESVRDVDFHGAHILLCEDHPLNARLVKKLLENKGAELTVAENGKLGLEQYTHCPDGYFNAVLMDIHMPVMDGKQASQAIRDSSRDDSETIPIIAITADVVADGLEELRQYGIKAYVPKPIDPERLYETLAKLIRLSPLS